MTPPTWKGSPNFTPGRGGHKPSAIVIHVIEGSLASCDSWFASPLSKVSAHYGVGLKREVHAYVKEESTAWANGRVDHPTWTGIIPGVNPNSYTISIEHEGTGTSVWPDTLYADSAQLVADIARRWKIPLDRQHIIRHQEIYSLKTCPGKGDVGWIVKLARLYALSVQELVAFQQCAGLDDDGVIGWRTREAWRLRT